MMCRRIARLRALDGQMRRSIGARREMRRRIGRMRRGGRDDVWDDREDAKEGREGVGGRLGDGTCCFPVRIGHPE
eukprot:1767826-Rhodomonas_salina.2